MSKILSKIGLGETMSKNFLAILIVAFGGAIIYGLPYFRFDYYDVYLETYHLTNIQMGIFGSVLGVFGMISYLFGGIVADRFSTRIILSVSLIGTGNRWVHPSAAAELRRPCRFICVLGHQLSVRILACMRQSGSHPVWFWRPRQSLWFSLKGAEESAQR